MKSPREWPAGQRFVYAEVSSVCQFPNSFKSGLTCLSCRMQHRPYHAICKSHGTTSGPRPSSNILKNQAIVNNPRKPSFNRRPSGASSHARSPKAATDEVTLFGLHAVEAALANPTRRIIKVMATENAARRLEPALQARGVTPENVSPRRLDQQLGADTVHQGVALETEYLPEPPIEDLLEDAVTGRPLVILDQVTDPHNVGAILRSAAAFGCAGLIMTRRHSPPLNGTLAKSASGALELVPVHLTQNLARLLTQLKENGITVIGLDGTAGEILDDGTFTGPVALILGAEGKGLRALTAETCDRLYRIEAPGALTSLNVSNAAAVSLHLLAMRRRAQTAN